MPDAPAPRAAAPRSSILLAVSESACLYVLIPSPCLISVNVFLGWPCCHGARAECAPKKACMPQQLPEHFEPGLTVLVIDDDEAVRSSLEMLLDAYGFQTVLARDGRQGMAAFRAEAPAVVLIDLMMPVQDGIETIALMRQEWPNARIIAMSSGAGIGDWSGLSAALKVGADHAIEKPFEADARLAILRAVATEN